MTLEFLVYAFVVPLILNYALLWLGLYILKIKKVSQKQMVYYSIAGVVMTNAVNFAIARTLFNVLGNLVRTYLYYGIAFIFTYFLIKYILKLKGDQLNKLFGYFIILNLILYLIFNF